MITVKAARAPLSKRANPPHSHAAAVTITPTTNNQTTKGRKNSAANNPASSRTAVKTRCRSIRVSRSGQLAARVGQIDDRRVGALRLAQLFAGAAETAFALLEGSDGRVQRGSVEVGPQQIGEIQLRVSQLPQQEIADALLAAGADEQIGLRREAHRQMRREIGFG